MPDADKEVQRAEQIEEHLDHMGEPNVAKVESILTSTPEGRALVKRVQEKDEELEARLREIGGDRAVQMKREMEKTFERAVLFGEVPIQDHSAWNSEGRIGRHD